MERMTMSEEISMELEEKDEMGESIMTEMGVAPVTTEEPLHPAIASLQSQMEVGLTDQIVGAAAIIRATAGNKRIMMQIGV